MSGSVVSAQIVQEQQRQVFLRTVVTLAQTLELRDPSTSGHSQRVTEYVLLLAEEMNLPAEEYQALQLVAPLHDIGKIGVGDAILRKPESLSAGEYEEMKQHSAKGAGLLRAIPDLAGAAQVIRGHHERWDGRGYPDGLAGESIPRASRLLAVADTFDALTFNTVYRQGVSPESACEQIFAAEGTQFDPACVQAFRQVRPRLHQKLLRRLQAAGAPGG